MTTAVNARRPISRLSLDEFVGPDENGLGNREPKRLRGLEIDDQVELGGLLDGKIRRLRAFQNLVHIPCGPSHELDKARAVGHEATTFWKFSVKGNRGQFATQREVCNASEAKEYLRVDQDKTEAL